MRDLLPRPGALITDGDTTVTQQHSTGRVLAPSGRMCGVSLSVMECYGGRVSNTVFSIPPFCSGKYFDSLGSFGGDRLEAARSGITGTVTVC